MSPHLKSSFTPLRIAATAVAILMVTAVSLVRPFQSADTAHSQIYMGSLIGGPFNRETYIGMSCGDHSSYYYDRAQLAIASWNLAQTSGSQYVTSFTQTQSVIASEIDWYCEDASASGWLGLTVFYDQGVPTSPTWDWQWAVITLNDYEGYILYGDAETDTQYTQRRTQSTAAHEMGHALGLSHSIFASRLMHDHINRYNNNGVYTPQSVDISELDSAY